MKTPIIKILLCALVSLTTIGLPAGGLAQEPTRQDVTRALAKLDQRIAEVREVVQAFYNAWAAELLQRAEQMRHQAAARLHPRQAMMDIQTASQLVEQAVKAALEAPLQRIRSQLEELMRRAENEVIGSGHREAEQFLQQAKKAQAAAEEALRAMMYRKAIEYYRLALHLTKTALALVGGPRHSAGPETTSLAREQFENLAARARDAIETSRNPAAKSIYEQAIKQGRSAETAMRNGNPAMALQLYNGAMRLLLRAIDLANSSTMNTANRLESELSLLEDLIASVEKQLGDKKDSRTAMLISRARLMVNEARHALERGNEQEAEWRLALARSFVSKALRAETPGAKVFESKLEEQLAQLSDDLKEMDQRAREQQNGEAGDFVALARLAAGKAEHASATGRPRVALQALLAAQRFLTSAEIMLSKSGSQQFDRNEVAQKLDQLDASLQEVAQSADASGNELAIDLVRQATEIRDRAREAFNRGRLRVANESAGVAMEMLRTALKISTSENNRREE